MIVVGASMVSVSTVSAGEKEEFRVDAVHSMALFGVKHQGAGRFYGRFNDLSGKIAFAEGSGTELHLDVTIKTASIDTGNSDLDEHLRSPDFFNEKEFPTMTFKSQSAKKRSDGLYDVVGELTLHGVTKKITVVVEWVGTKEGQRGKRCGMEANFKIKRSDYGMSSGVSQGALGDETRVIVALEAVSGGRNRGN
jgi:polyisoprenoid-binding protein YceI